MRRRPPSKPLSERFYFRVYRGCRLYMADFSYLPDEETALQAVCLSLEIVRLQPPKSIYAYSDFTQSFFSISLLQQIRKLLPAFDPYLAAQAYFGLSPMQRVIYNNVAKLLRHPNRAVATPDEGLDFLVERYRADRKDAPQQPRL